MESNDGRKLLYRSTTTITTIITTIIVDLTTIVVVVIALCFADCLASNSQSTSRSLEYCDTEVLRAECADDNVIVMDRATYGRMRLGRCVEMEMGHIGCFTDVIKMADRRCSGRRVCELRVPDAEFESTEPCLKELKSYLEASYTCVKLENRGKECSMEGENKGSVGHISNEVSEEGGIPCPVADQSWVISGKPGQHVRLILYDFSITEDALSRQTTTLMITEEDKKCRQYGTVYDTEREETQMICGSHAERISHIYTSTGNGVKLYLQASYPSHRYLIRFSVEGCPWPNLPEGAWLKNKSLDVMFIGCSFSNSSWRIVCSGGSWGGFNNITCPKLPTTTTTTTLTSTTSLLNDQLLHVPTENLLSSKIKQQEFQRKFQTFQHRGNELQDDDRFVEFAGLLATTITAIIAIVVLIILIIKVSRETSHKQGGDEASKRNSILLRENPHKEPSRKKETTAPNFDQNENQRLLTSLRLELETPSIV